jgi:2-oxoglutarate dehydrogenase E2 component (dihydrolipoamide succinyltransferase)
VLPALGESVTEGTITRWLKNVGDSVSLDEAIVEISTDKVDTELPSPAAGVITEIKVSQDQVAAVGAVLAVISSSAGAAAPKPATPTPAPAPVVQTPPPAPKVETVVVTQSAPVATPTPTVFATSPSSTKDTYATPIVRQLAKEKGIDISTISGSGVNGRVKKEDVLNATGISAVAQVIAPPVAQPVTTPVAAPVATPTPVPTPAKPAAPAASVEQPLRGRIEQTTRLRRVIAERMVQSLQISAQLTSVVEVDVTKISSLRNQVKESFVAREGVKL